MNEIDLSKKPPAGAKRDAIHIAIISMVAAERVNPGQEVGIDKDGEASGVAQPFVGVVNPFLQQSVAPRERFWLLLNPYTITSLRHEWVHPAFDSDQESKLAISRKFVKEFAALYGFGEDQFMTHAGYYAESGDDLNMGENESYKDIDANWDEFWKHYEILTGKSQPRYKGHFFSCAC